MAQGRQPAKYSERTTNNVMACISTHYSSEALGIPLGHLYDYLVTDFRCQRPTAVQMVERAVLDGALVWLKFSTDSIMSGIYKGDPYDPTTYVPVMGGGIQCWSSGLDIALLQSDRYFSNRHLVRAGRSAVAVAETFLPWLEANNEQEISRLKKARDKQQLLEAMELQRLGREFPNTFALITFARNHANEAERADTNAPITVSAARRKDGVDIALTLSGPLAEQSAGAMLAALEFYYGSPGETLTGQPRKTQSATALDESSLSDLRIIDADPQPNAEGGDDQ